eukprot:TRINITY_DN4346_c0_g1_i1.p1 TRINITY_DN4346_c0_g1~~TRINITY_DN4346_c0_g1_i1.p1  ORF type:complete len:1097 (+),score=274.82 TRINITY_DN4346_c0_g1_i1:93-3383(+)
MDPLVCKRCTFRNKEKWSVCMMCSLQVGEQGASLQMHGISFTKQANEMMKKVKAIEKQDKMYTDTEFPDNLHSLYGDGEVEEIKKWKRCSEMGTEWKFAAKDDVGLPVFSPDAIEQGGLGNCWFLSALAVVCTRSEFIRRIFISKKNSPSGVYALRFWHNGVWTPVLIDDYLPITDWGSIAYARGKGNVLWPSLIEKAYAKLHGSYNVMCSGRAKEAFTNLTGAPCSSVSFDEPDAVWAELVKAESGCCLMAASCGKTGASSEEYLKLGLITRHSYTILGVTDTLGVKLLNLRNPWGNTEWNGRWGKGSSLWTPEKLQQLGASSATENGAFWIELSDFLEYFSRMDICKTHEDWFSCREEGEFSRAAVPSSGTSQFSDAYVLKANSPTWAFLSIVQRDERGADKGYCYTDTAMTVVRVTKDEAEPDPKHFEHVAAVASSSQRITTCEVMLNKPGTYLVFPMSMRNQNGDTSFILATWSSKKITIGRQHMKDLSPLIAALHCMFLSPTSYPKIKVTEPLEDIRFVTIEGVGGYWYFAANYTNKTLEVTLDATSSVGLVSDRGLKTVDTIPPGRSMILMMLIPSIDSWSRSSSTKYRLSSSIEPCHNPALLETAHLHEMLRVPVVAKPVQQEGVKKEQPAQQLSGISLLVIAVFPGDKRKRTISVSENAGVAEVREAAEKEFKELGRALKVEGFDKASGSFVDASKDKKFVNEERVQVVFNVPRLKPLTENEGNLALHHAARNGDTDSMRLLRNHGVDPGLKSSDNRTLLHSAAEGGFVDAITLLIEEWKQDPGAKADNAWTPLHSAAWAGRVDAMKLLINKYNQSPGLSTNDGWTPLHSAAEGGHTKAVDILLKQYKQNPGFKTVKKGWTAVQAAAWSGSVELVKRLVEGYDEGVAETTCSGWTPLHAAAWGGHVELVQYLVETKKQKPGVKSNDGWTPLHLAALKGHYTTVQALTAAHGGEPEVKNNLGGTPLHCAAVNGSIEIIELLINKCKHDPGAPCNDGSTPLHHAASKGNVAAMELLINEYKQKAGVRKIDGRTPLHSAAAAGSMDATVLLINEHNQNPSSTDFYGRTPYDEAKKQGEQHMDVISYLEGCM